MKNKMDRKSYIAIGIAIVALISGFVFVSHGTSEVVQSDTTVQSQTDSDVIEYAVKKYMTQYLSSGEIGRSLLTDKNFMDALNNTLSGRSISDVVTDEDISAIASKLAERGENTDFSELDRSNISLLVQEIVDEQFASRNFTSVDNFLTQSDVESIREAVLVDVNKELHDDIAAQIDTAVKEVASNVSANDATSDVAIASIEKKLKQYVDSKVSSATSSVKSGEDGANGKAGRDGVDGKNGVDGYTPIKGVDYFTESDIAEITGMVKSDIITNGSIVIKGEKGDTGKSAYDIYVESVPAGERVLTEEEWNRVITNGTDTILKADEAISNLNRNYSTVTENNDQKLADMKKELDDNLKAINDSYDALVNDYNVFVSTIKDTVAEEMTNQLNDQFDTFINNIEYHVNNLYSNTLSYKVETDAHGDAVLVLEPFDPDDIPYDGRHLQDVSSFDLSGWRASDPTHP